MKYVTKKNSKLDIIYSDEGGRFYKNETRNIISLIPNYKISFSILNMYGFRITK